MLVTPKSTEPYLNHTPPEQTMRRILILFALGLTVKTVMHLAKSTQKPALDTATPEAWPH